VTLPSEYDPAGYTYRPSLFEDGKRHLVMRRSIPLDCPVRLLHGMKDVSVPWQTSLTLSERLASRDVVLTLIKDGDHRLSRETDLERLGRSLDELLGNVR
jgi:alpha-beta hydrolase superfamily lysophospholipase